MMRRILVLALSIAALTVRPCRADPEPHSVAMAIHPARPSSPAMKFHLLPEVRELRQGNGAVFYQRSHSPEWYPVVTRHADFGHFHEWLDLPLGKAPLDKIGAFLNSAMLRELDIAARTEYCDWQLLDRARQEGPGLLLPDMQGFRALVVLLALRSRLEIREGKLDKAAYTFQTGFAMSRHVGEAPVLVNYLIGAAFANTMLNRVEEFVQQPDAPNLYWALTDLPRPLIDLRRPLQSERLMVDGLFPEIRKALDDPTAPPVPVAKLHADLARFGIYGTRPDPLGSAASMAMVYPRARKYLLEQGRPAADVAALSVTQASLMYGMAQYDLWSEDFYKLNNLPYWEARPRLDDLKKQWLAVGKNMGGQPSLLESLVFSPEHIFSVKARLQRRIDALRCVEAIRLYAAAHADALPQSLAEIVEVPIPLDPITGKAFHYLREGDRAILEGVAPPGEPAAEHNTFRFAIRVAAAPGKKN